MRYFFTVITAMSVMILTCGIAGATPISISAADWDGYAYLGSLPSVTNTTDGLKVTASTNRGNISAFSENENFKNETINLQWKVDSDGGQTGDIYNEFYVGVGEWNNAGEFNDIVDSDWLTTKK